MTGKEKCKLQKQIRKEIAETNGIVYLTSECSIDGECEGTCPKCDAEIRYLDSEIKRLAQEGKSISLSGLTLSSIDASINCVKAEESDDDYSCDWYESLEGMHRETRRERPENIYEWTIEELDVSVRSYYCLKRAGINTVKDIVERGREGLIGIRNMGRKNIEEIMQKVESIGGKAISEDEK